MQKTGTLHPWFTAAMVTLAGCETTMVAPGLEARLEYSAWSAALSIETALSGADPAFNTASVEGCPFISPDGRTFYIASNRPGGQGGLDIWVATRASPDDPWSAPANVGAPVNSPADDFCPTMARDGQTFYFVSKRQTGDEGVDWCGGGDIYLSRWRPDQGFEAPRNLGCEVNSPADEFSPFPVENAGGGPGLFYSSTRAGTGDLYFSPWHGAGFGAGEPIAGVNSPSDDGQPNVSRDGLALYFYSNRADPAGQGGNDLYVSIRGSLTDPWPAPVNLGPNVNSAASETRPSLSWDGTALYFGSTRPGEGSSDVYVTTRSRITGLTR